MSLRSITVAGFLVALFTIPVPDARSEEFHNALSLQGFTGILNTPNGATTGEGKFYSLYSDQKENILRNRLRREESYLFSVGLFKYLELGGRLTEAPYADIPANKGRSVIRDLSANIKIQLPLLPEGEYIPRFALGVQDLGGGAHHFRTAYGVASEELGRLRLSVGYGTGNDRMRGLFGGAEIKAFDWLYLLGEYDTVETNVGLRLVSPELFGIPVNLNVTAKASVEHNQGRPEFGFGFQIPLGLNHWNSMKLPEPKSQSSAEASEQGAGDTKKTAGEKLPELINPAPQNAKTGVEGDRRTALVAMQERLVSDGFQNLKIGEGDGGLLVVEFENSRYNQNELDGIGVVAGIVSEMAPQGYETLRLVVLKKGIRTVQLTSPAAEMHAFMQDASRLEALRQVLVISPDPADGQGVSYLGGATNSSWLQGKLVLFPEIKTFVGTDYSVFDYLLSIKPDFYLNSWKGGVVNARWDIPVSWSDGFKEGKLYRDNRNESRLDRLMLFQSVKLGPTLMASIGGGMVLPDVYGALNELLWSPGEGSHRFNFRHAYGDNTETNGKNESYLASYRFRYDPLDLYLEGTGGRFWGRDTGFTLEMKRFFGDTAFSIYYKNTESAAREHVQAGGVQLSFPLTPRRDMKPCLVQVKGADEWSYAQETEIVSPGGGPNQVGRNIAVNPKPAFNLANVYYNRDRLSEPYIKRNLLRLRDAYLNYGVKQL